MESNSFQQDEKRLFRIWNSSPVREEFDYGEGGRSVSEDRIEIGDVQIDGVVAKISVARFDGAEERTRSRR